MLKSALLKLQLLLNNLLVSSYYYVALMKTKAITVEPTVSNLKCYGGGDGPITVNVAGKNVK